MYGGLPGCQLSSRRPLAFLAITLALLAMSEQSIEIRHDRAFTTTCADEAKQPVDQRRDAVLKPRQERNVHHKPQEPRKPAREPYAMHADDCAAAINCGHGPEIPVLERNSSVAAFDPLSNGASSM